MTRLLLSSLIIGLLCVRLPGATVVVMHRADDSLVSGELTAVGDGKLRLTPTSDSQPVDGVTLPLFDIARVAFREAPPAGPTTRPTAATRPATSPATREDVADEATPGALVSAIRFFLGPPPSAPASDSAGPAAPPRPTTAPVRVATDRGAWEIRLAGGDVVHGRVDAWSNERVAIRLNAPDGPRLDMPSAELAEIWCGTPAEVTRARATNVDRGAADDVVFAEKGGEVVGVKGQVVGIEGDALKLYYEGAVRSIALDRLVGIVARAAAGPAGAPDAFHQTVHFALGDVLSGAWEGVDDATAHVRTAWGQVVSIPLTSIDAIECVNGRLASLSDLKPASVEQTPYFGRVIPFRIDASLEGGPLRLSDGQYKRGIAVHSRCVLAYDLGGRFDRFRAKLGFEEPAGRAGRAAVRVVCGQKTLYANADARGDQPPVNLDLDVAGQQRLTLEVDFGQGQDVAGRVIWADARLLRAAGAAAATPAGRD